ncbi:MAG: carboxypeptidase-like regulatory domain-containing protein [Crocinitomicaceae bacterium]|nr:carboxypeptidase-like regulatory domain-containing protein [Crocinitomicaceae bacterium]
MEKAVFKIVQTLCALGFMVTAVNAQTEIPPLERVVSVELNAHTARESLKRIEAEGRFSFAYQTELVDGTQQLSRIYQNKTTREILDDIFQGEVKYKEKGNYIILKKSPKLKELEIKLDGYIFDTKTLEKIAFATLFDTVTLTSTLSNSYGHYSLKMNKKQEIQFTVKRVGYHDTTFVWNGEGNSVLNIGISPIESAEPVDTIGVENRFKLFKLTEDQKANLNNFKENLKQKVQFSIIPGVGTNGDLSPVTAVDYSINLFGGFNGGVKKAEIGGIFNIVWDSVQFFQAAGFFNAVGGNQRGLQLAGFANLNNASFTGAQMSGFLNVTRRDFRGAQMAGFMNSTLQSLSGFQAAGFGNYAGDSSEVIQMAGFGNYVGHQNNGVQVAGFINIARREFEGTQLSGFYNYLGRDGGGLQMSGFANTALGNFEGAQVSGFVNYAKKIKGVQIGFINISDSIEGVPIGFFSFSRHGYHQLELSTNEVTPINLAFKTGTHQFYNSFLIGGRFSSTNNYLSYGYGIGSSIRASKRSRVFFDLQASQIQRANATYRVNILSKFTVSYHFNLTKNIGIAAGPSFNVLLSDNTDPLGLQTESLVPYDFYNQNHGDANVKMWVGGQIALRFF